MLNVDLINIGDSTPALFLLSNGSAIGWNIVATYGPIGPGNPNGTNGYQGCFADPVGNSFGIPGVITGSGHNEYVQITRGREHTARMLPPTLLPRLTRRVRMSARLPSAPSSPTGYRFRQI